MYYEKPDIAQLMPNKCPENPHALLRKKKLRSDFKRPGKSKPSWERGDHPMEIESFSTSLQLRFRLRSHE
jgi:hypothetical protein